MKALVLATALLVAGGSAAAAQDGSKGDVFAGYSMLAGEGATRHGWHGALGWGISGRLGLIFDVSGHQGDADGSDVSVLSLMAGPRVVLGGGRVRPFVHVIGGVVRAKSSIGIFDVEIAESSTGYGGAAGGGFDYGFGDRWALRLAADYRVIRIDEETLRDPRFSAGVVYRFGAR